jgi:hypothetical protein
MNRIYSNALNVTLATRSFMEKSPSSQPYRARDAKLNRKSRVAPKGGPGYEKRAHKIATRRDSEATSFHIVLPMRRSRKPEHRRGNDEKTRLFLRIRRLVVRILSGALRSPLS